MLRYGREICFVSKVVERFMLSAAFNEFYEFFNGHVTLPTPDTSNFLALQSL